MRLTRFALFGFLGFTAIAGLLLLGTLSPRAANAQVMPPAVIVDRDPVVEALQYGAWAGPGVFESSTAGPNNKLFIETTGNRQDVAVTIVNAGATRLDVFNPPGTLVGQIPPKSTTTILLQIQAISNLNFTSVDIGNGQKTSVRWVIRKA